MRHGRAKAARKTLQFFKLTVGLKPPYYVIVDGTFLVSMIEQKVPLRDRFFRTLQRQAYQIFVTRSSLAELDMLSKQDTPKSDLFRQARQWGLDNSDAIIEPSDIPPLTDTEKSQGLGDPSSNIVALIQSKPEYIVCSQDETLLELLRYMGDCPIIRIARGVVLLENPSKSAQRKASRQEATKWRGTVDESEQKLISHMKKERNRKDRKVQSQAARHDARKKNKAKGPNPLSCKKKRPTAGGDANSTQKKRRTTA